MMTQALDNVAWALSAPNYKNFKSFKNETNLIKVDDIEEELKSEDPSLFSFAE
jgi:hypothetical protein